MKFLQLIQQDKTAYKFDGPLKFKFTKPLESNEVRLHFVTELVETLAK